MANFAGKVRTVILEFSQGKQYSDKHRLPVFLGHTGNGVNYSVREPCFTLLLHFLPFLFSALESLHSISIMG